MTTKPYEFPQSRTETTGAGPDFPGSSGDRERGKFRPSATPRLVTVAVVGDDGRSVPETTDGLLAEILEYQKAILLGLSIMSEGSSFSVRDVLASKD